VRVSMISAALVAALVGYGSTIALVLAAAAAGRRGCRQTASWVAAICFSKAIGSALLSGWKKVPVVLAWSTPGAALIAASTGVDIHQAVGAFIFAWIADCPDRSHPPAQPRGQCDSHRRRLRHAGGRAVAISPWRWPCMRPMRRHWSCR
jgi:acyl-CoA reductase-like NAD-dependent aldehyde dehydrogenase